MPCLKTTIRQLDGLSTTLSRLDGLVSILTNSRQPDGLSTTLSRLDGLVSILTDGTDGHLTACYSLVCGTHTDREGAVLSASDGDLYDGNNELIYAAE